MKTLLLLAANIVGGGAYDIGDGSHSVVVDQDQSGFATIYNIERGSTSVLEIPPPAAPTERRPNFGHSNTNRQGDTR